MGLFRKKDKKHVKLSEKDRRIIDDIREMEIKNFRKVTERERDNVRELLKSYQKLLEIEDAITFPWPPRKEVKVPETKCPIDGKTCPISAWNHDRRRNCPLYRCPLDMSK